jgi:hypothetical protein
MPPRIGAKSTFVYSHISHGCPLMEHKQTASDNRDDSGKESSHVNPAFAFYVSDPITVAQNQASVCFDVPFFPEAILEVFSDLLLKPPSFPLFV